MVGVERDLWRSPNPTTLLKHVHLEQAAQNSIQADLTYLQRRRLHNIYGQYVSVLRHPQREEVLPHVQTELPVLQFVPITLSNNDIRFGCPDLLKAKQETQTQQPI